MEIKAVLNKPYTEKERLDFIVENNHKLGYVVEEVVNALIAWGADENELLAQAKQEKIQENDLKRDESLNQGVEYKGVLFDSDTDQKVNLLAIISTIPDTVTMTWFGMDNQPLECTKDDLINIGNSITALHAFCWNKNAEIKKLINEAQTIEEVTNIVIDYTRPENIATEVKE